MSQPVSVQQFTGLFTLYVLISLAIYFTASFTIPAWIIYFLFIIPFYFLCILYLIIFSLEHRQKKIKYRRSLVFLSIIFQFLSILPMPTSCYGWKQGKSCYSFIQTHLTQADLTSFKNSPAHWSFIESMLVPTLMVYVVSVVVFLATLQIQEQS
jgi:hypothetical protein